MHLYLSLDELKKIFDDAFEQGVREGSDRALEWCREEYFRRTFPPNEHSVAVETLKSLGYTYNGGERWKPPLGSPPQDASWFDADIEPRPLHHPLHEYHVAGCEGEALNYTWTDKPHRLLYDLVAAVKYYATRVESTDEFRTAYRKACDSSDPRDWMSVALAAQRKRSHENNN